MKKYYLLISLFIFSTATNASIKENIINNLKDIDNITFKFEQNTSGKIENGTCTIKYSKKIFCKYETQNKKILVSNGKSLVIKTLNSYYIYPLKKTPLDLILDKNFLMGKIKNMNEKKNDDNFINFHFIENNNNIDLFFDKKSYDLIGWQTIDIYQNQNITNLYMIDKNTKIKDNLFKSPNQDYFKLRLFLF